MSFSIITDSACNLTTAQIKDFDIRVVSLTYSSGDEEILSYVEGEEVDFHAFYNRMRAGESFKTSLVSYDRVEASLKAELDKGNDVLYIAFSSALSGTCQIARNCIGDLAESYPDRTMILVDSLCASMGQGLFVKYAVDKRKEGLSVTETAQWLEEHKLNLVHLFTVDDLVYLRRGGRLSGTVAIVGTILNIKPLLHVDNEGRLVSYGKTRGRKASVEELFKRMGELGEDLKNQEIYISHGDCIEDAEAIAEKMKKVYKVKGVTINYLDQVIGCHSGPGTLAIFFMGKKR